MHAGKRKRVVLGFLVAQLVAVGAGISAAHVTAASHANRYAWATAHCTRYEPYTAVDTYCFQDANAPPGGTEFQANTTSTALRDDNGLQTDKTVSWGLYYISNGVQWNLSTGYSTYSLAGGSGSTYAQSACEWDNSPQVQYNYCSTDWHT